MDYKKIDTGDVEYLVTLLGRDRVFTDEEINDDFSHDEMGGISRKPDVLVDVLTTEEVSKIMKYAYDHRIPVVARGSGTGLEGASV
ncbi:MAG: FAD-binding oxidoreductase, partial [Paenibacillaceae bacterium]|nr:FAD-binding oxidoreductase [Paenibacillaceae bacterium]